MGRTNDKYIKQLIKDCLVEMKRNQTILLLRGDLIPEETIPLYKEMYNRISSLKDKDWKDKEEFVRCKEEYIFKPDESFVFCLFDTHQFAKLFELYEYE